MPSFDDDVSIWQRSQMRQVRQEARQKQDIEQAENDLMTEAQNRALSHYVEAASYLRRRSVEPISAFIDPRPEQSPNSWPLFARPVPYRYRLWRFSPHYLTDARQPELITCSNDNAVRPRRFQGKVLIREAGEAVVWHGTSLADARPDALQPGCIRCSERKYDNADPAEPHIIFADTGGSSLDDCYSVPLAVPLRSWLIRIVGSI